MLLLEYLLRLDLSRVFLLLFVVYSFTLLTVFRSKAGSVVGLIRREFGTPHHVMVVGVTDRALLLARMLEGSERYGIALAGFLGDHDGPTVRAGTLKHAYPVYPLERLRQVLHQHVVDEIVFAVDSRQLAELEDTFLLCDEEGVRTRVAVDFFPHVNSEIYLERLGATPLLTFSAAPHDEIQLLLKRTVRYRSSRSQSGSARAADVAAGRHYPAHIARADNLPADTVRTEWPSLYLL